MRIAFVTPAYKPAIMGAALYSSELAELLIAKGHDVRVFTPLMKGMKKRETINLVPVFRTPIIQITESYYVSPAMVRSILKEKFDVIHSHHYGYFPATAGLLAAKLSKTPHVFGPYYHPPVYGARRWILFTAYHATQGLPLIRFSDRVLPHTEFEKKMLLKAGGKEDNMDILPNIVDAKKFSYARRKSKIVLFAGNMIRERGADVALDIAGRLSDKDTTFVFIGRAYQKDILEKIERLKATKNIKFLHSLPLNELIKWYQRASLLILPSRYEAFSRVIAEAQSCGCAVVATRVGGIPEVVAEGESGFLVDYGDWGEMEEKIKFLLDNPKIIRKMGLAGSKRVKEHFDSRAVAKQLEKIYQEVVA